MRIANLITAISGVRGILSLMAYALALNPGSNSLKFELVEIRPEAAAASELPMLASATLDDIGKEPKLSVFEGRKVVAREACEAADMQAAVGAAVRWLREQEGLRAAVRELAFVAVRVVHGADRFHKPVEVNREVREAIASLQELSPLHNRSSLEILEVLGEELPSAKQMVAFDTAFHQTLPEVAWRYPIERELADRFGVRKYGFHGLSHRYLLNQYAKAVGKLPEECTLITLHLESGSSACAIRNGQSVDTTMGLTPLEGLMMGSRSGSVDPAVVPYLMGKLHSDAGEVMEVLEKKSGLLGVASGTLDTRELVKRDDRWAKLALAMFSYRVRLAVGAYLAALGRECEAVVFGGGIGEDSPWLREEVCEGLRGWGLELDAAANASLTEGEGRITKDGSRLHAWGMAVEEGLQMVWECLEAGKQG